MRELCRRAVDPESLLALLLSIADTQTFTARLSQRIALPQAQANSLKAFSL